MLLKWEVGGRELVMEITLLIMENHGIVILNFCGNPGVSICLSVCLSTVYIKVCLSAALSNLT